MNFTGNEDHSIVIEDAAAMTKSYRDANPGMVLGGYFGKAAVQAILAQEGCVGIRYYNALNDNGEHTVVLVGVKANKDDIENGILAEFAKPIPPFAGVDNQLNS